MGLAAVPIDGHPLAFHGIGLIINKTNICFGGFMGEIDGFRDSIVRIALKNRLHADVILGLDVVGRDKHLFHGCRNRHIPLQGAPYRQSLS